MGALLLSAFAFEGYLNYLGRKLFSSWESFERSLSWQAKVNLIADRIGFDLEPGHRPLQTLKLLFQFRDNVAHPKPRELQERYETDELEEARFYEGLQTEAEKFCTAGNVKRSLEDVEQMIKRLHAKAGFDDKFVLFRGGTSGKAGSA